MSTKERFMRTCPTISEYHRMIMGYSNEYISRTNPAEYYINRILNMYGKGIPFKYTNLCYLIRYHLKIYK